MKSRCPSRDKCSGYDRCLAGEGGGGEVMGAGCQGLDPFWAPGTFQMAPVTTTRSEMRIKLWKMEFLGKSKAYYNARK